MVVGLLNLRQAGSRHLRHFLQVQPAHHTLGDCKVPEAVGHKMGLSSGIDIRDRHDALEVLVKINDRLRHTLINLKVTDDELNAINARLTKDKDKQALDFTNRYVRRVFNEGSFDAGGRFTGGWWQQVPREYRKHIRIGENITVELDFKTLHPSILYMTGGLNPPEDSYDINGWADEHRDLIKKAFNQILNAKPANRNKNLWLNFAPDLLNEDNHPGWGKLNKAEKAKRNQEEFVRLTYRPYDELIADIVQKHKPIEHHFFSQAWTWLQKDDSDMAEKIMLRALEEDLMILPV